MYSLMSLMRSTEASGSRRLPSVMVMMPPTSTTLGHQASVTRCAARSTSELARTTASSPSSPPGFESFADTIESRDDLYLVVAALPRCSLRRRRRM